MLFSVYDKPATIQIHIPFIEAVSVDGQSDTNAFFVANWLILVLARNSAGRINWAQVERCLPHFTVVAYLIYFVCVFLYLLSLFGKNNLAILQVNKHVWMEAGRTTRTGIPAHYCG